MHRRDILRTLFLSTATAKTLLSEAKATERLPSQFTNDQPHYFKSNWQQLPDMIWTGEMFWAQRLQDWCIKKGELLCVCHGMDRTVHLLTHQLSEQAEGFKAVTTLRFLNSREVAENDLQNYAGFRLGIRGRFDDYRSAIMTGKGIDTGITRNGFLLIGNTTGDKQISEEVLTTGIRLVLTVTPQSSGRYFAKLKALDNAGNTLATLSAEQEGVVWQGNIALVSHTKTGAGNADAPTVAFKELEMEGKKLTHHPDQVYGPIYFAQYTLQSHTLKLTAQMAPMDIAGAEAVLYIQHNSQWKQAAISAIDPQARIARFRINNWKTGEQHPYKVVYRLPLNSGQQREYSYEGTIAAEPLQKQKVKALACSCNWDYGFPDKEVSINAAKHNADMIFFLGDQFYEPNGGFSIQMHPLEKAELDYLRKWYQFGWSYRNLFRHIPMVALPDDHDVFHGNVWGAGGKATIAKGDGADKQDSGGYKMPATWVNMVQLTQTSHMPDAFDPTPVLQNIGVYYTHWEYGGISFGIIEDRKFKSPPKNILPPEAKVWNGYAANPQYNRSGEKNNDAELLGRRQVHFLEQWAHQRKPETLFKVLVSASPFACLQTLPRGTMNDQGTPDLPIPEKGTYLEGDAVTMDMDSNGWPHNRRNEVLGLLKDKINLHLVGDQHLPSVVQYGVDAYEDNAYAFAVPALNNIWPRRWWPPLTKDHQPLPGKPAYTGHFEDGFGNKLTVHAVANPHRTGRLPAILYDRVTGYGVVEFDKTNAAIRLECWPRYVNPAEQPAEQYEGWPVTITAMKKNNESINHPNK